ATLLSPRRPISGGASSSIPHRPNGLPRRARLAGRAGPAIAFSVVRTIRESSANDRRLRRTSNGSGGRVVNPRIMDGRFRARSMRSPTGAFCRLLICVIILAYGLSIPLAAQAAAPRVALVLDQHTPGALAQVATLQREIEGFFRPGDITLLAPLAGDGTAAGVRRMLNRALGDSTVAAIVAL